MPLANSYDAYPDFFLRTPVLPLDFISKIPGNIENLHDFVVESWEDTVVKNAILLASPNLYDQLNIETKAGNISPGLINAFLKYFMRMCYRSTPFGLFAGVGAGVIGSSTNIRIKEASEHSMRSRLDMEYLGASVMAIMSYPDIKKELAFRSNTSLYRIASTWRYTEVFFQKNNKKKYRIVSIDSNEVIDRIISRSTKFRTWKDICSQITEMGYQYEESEAFINQLIHSQILIPDIFPNLTGKEFSVRLKGKLEDLSINGAFSETLLEMIKTVETSDRPKEVESLYSRIKALAEKSGIKYSSSHLIQSDLKCSFESVRLSKELVNKVLLGIRILRSLTIPRTNRVLEEFKKYFFDRFGTREVPLPLVMDADFGIALTGPEGQQLTDPAPLLEGMDFTKASEELKQRSPHRLLQRKLTQCKEANCNYIHLDRSDIKELGIRKGEWPEQLFALVRLSGSTDSPKVVFDFASGGNPANIMARFGFLDQDGRLGAHINELIADDEARHQDNITAEIVHLPEDRTGNILQRPSYYNWEIPYLATPGKEESIIAISDILVSLKGDKLILRERQSGKVILPRLTNAHNYSFRQLPLYQFLAECINQDVTPGYYPEWGWLSDRNEFIPGIEYGNLILSLPKWKIRIERELKKLKLSDEGLYGKIIEWTVKHKLPGKIVWVNGDHEMFINWSVQSIVLAAWEGMRMQDVVMLKEYPYETGSPVKGSGGDHANELILSFKKER